MHPDTAPTDREIDLFQSLVRGALRFGRKQDDKQLIREHNKRTILY